MSSSSSLRHGRRISQQTDDLDLSSDERRLNRGQIQQNLNQLMSARNKRNNQRSNEPSPLIVNSDDDADDERLRWRQEAQMLIDDDDYDDDFYFNSSSLERNQHERDRRRATPSGASRNVRLTSSTDHHRQPDETIADDSSSISFAQSGCHSILSAWRIKAANKAARQLAADNDKTKRPTSVLSNASSAGKKSATSTVFTIRSGKSPASQTRIPIGPKSAQHFVTNSRRRRRANELILNTLEARRRAIALNRQNASLLGSASYLGGFDEEDQHQADGRASLSPSPQQHQLLGRARRTPSPAGLHLIKPRSALSDLGTRASPAAQAQRHRALFAATTNNQQHRVDVRGMNKSARNPPLAKLDQNSSDLYSSNSSSSDDLSSSQDSSSQFTQLVTSDLATNSCILLEEASSRNQATRRDHHHHHHHQQQQQQPVASPDIKKPNDNNELQQQTADEEAGKLRRGALKRDSIRRLRLNRQQQQQQQQQNNSSSSSDGANQQQANNYPSFNEVKRGRASSTSKSDIENNPFLNRHHFRSVSARQATVTKRQQQPQEQLQQAESTKRNSWLFSSGRASQSEQQQQQQQNNKNEATRANKLSSNEAINEYKVISSSYSPATTVSASVGRTGSSSHKVSKQHEPKQRLSNVMADKRKQQFSKPTITSSSSSSSYRVALDPIPPARAVNRAASPRGVSSSLGTEPSRGAPALPAKKIHPPTSREPTKSGQSSDRLDGRIVKEGAKSSDDLRFDLMGNRRQYEMNERWRYERDSNPISSIVEDEKGRRLELMSQEQMIKERIEVISSSSISPPLQFADPTKDTAGSAPKKTTRASNDVWRRAVSEERPTRRKAYPEQQQQRSQVVTKPAPVVSRRSTSSNTLAPTKRAGESSLANKSTGRSTTQSESLPKFERTADDEFRKRVDYLRKLAKANLDNDSNGRQNNSKMNLTKPMSTNWQANPSTLTSKPIISPKPRSNEQQAGGSSLFDDRAKWNLGPLAKRKSYELNRPRTPPASYRATTTNLDALLTERENSTSRPKSEGFQWRRSNSSLASIRDDRSMIPSTWSKAATAGSSSDPSATIIGGSLKTSQSNLSNLSSGSASRQPEVMKLIVKEKSAPRLDYAFVERQQREKQQEQPKQPAPQVNQPKPRTIPQAQPRPQLKPQPTQQALEQVQSSKTTSSVVSSTKTLATTTQVTRTRSPIRMASPRSPEFGPAAASSNDDSAIASSVSSPSLSYMLQNVIASDPGSSPAKTITSLQQQARPAPSMVPRPQISTGQQDSSAGALQSILRRQQQESVAQLPIQGLNQRVEQQQRYQDDMETRINESPISRQQRGSSGSQPLGQSGSEMNEPNQQSSSVTRRVTFNDRTSIRSFESVSSLASNSTAVPNEEAFRQQVGSPDSMGSGSTSRLSGESPDPMAQGRRTTEAAIYGIRGDPELEMDVQESLSPSAVAMVHTQQPGPHMMPQSLAYMPQHRFVHQQSYQIQPPRQNPVIQHHYLRMNAPASINTTQLRQHQQQQQSSPVQYIVRPTSSTSTHILPVSRAPPPPPPPIIPDEDPEEPDYALRLRQAATSRVFANYAPNQAQPNQLQQQLNQTRRRPTMEELLSYQTEV